MKLTAVLTVGWNDDPQHAQTALRLHQAAQNSKDYNAALGKALPTGQQQITGLERLFRRRTGGFSDIKQFVSVLLSLPPKNDKALQCEIDVFAYAFLRGAKNFDLLMPVSNSADGSFQRVYPQWQKVIHALEDFERLGEPLPQGIDINKDNYLKLRQVVTRKSARDERRTLTTLLVSGLSTLEELSADMGLNYPLAQRTLGVFVNIGVVEQLDGGIYKIVESALPLVVFCLRETMGLDLLSCFEQKEN